MACIGGACGKDGMEYRMVLYGFYLAVFAVCAIWFAGYHLTAYALAAAAAAVWFAGERLSRGFDRGCNVATKAWRAFARRPGRRYCPECACALSAPKEGRPVFGAECPKCEGSWVDSRLLLRWLAPYGTAESTWRAIPRDELSAPMLCPECAVPLEPGSLDRLQPLFTRCGACDGHWINRMTWTWFSLTPPATAKPVRAESPAAPQSPVPELVLRKSSAP
jgi:Zn-finger nucleic acid-binding protein